MEGTTRGWRSFNENKQHKEIGRQKVVKISPKFIQFVKNISTKCVPPKMLKALK